MRATEETFRDIVAALRAEGDPEAVLLFGSYARGEATDVSDIDLMVIRRRDFAPGESRGDELVRLYRAVGAVWRQPKDIVLITRSEFEDWRETTNHLAAQAYRSGRLLYGKI